MSTINVNLAQCTCGGRSKDGQPFWSSGEHHSMCHATPINIPCRLPPSVTFEVVLGECISPAACGLFSKAHLPDCPARPVRVSCSISGKTWEDSEVTECEHPPMTTTDSAAIWVACRQRWHLIKALLMGWASGNSHEQWIPAALVTQRDAIFSSIAKLERADVAAREAHQEAFKALEKADVAYSAMTPVGSRAEAMLAAYVARLIEQVGGMT